MKQRFVLIFAVLSIWSLLFAQESEGLVGLKGIAHWGTKGIQKSASIAKGAATHVRTSIPVPIIGAKKALLLAPITVPLAIGKAIYFLQLKTS
jgi:hypothetical protein